ncbi:MAG: prepilin-type N-terminal cleavage/methylation domain-containing protein [Kiritimatiellae bacterium]|nr:prepilin-type N-terminal cleavage/methylation domain-containing protein [Kiritimatiellia bacterium]
MTDPPPRALARPAAIPLRRRGTHGFSLIEVLIATAILAVGLLAVFSALSPSLAIFSASRRLQEVQWVMALGELKHPVAAFEDLEDLVVEEDGDLSFEDEKLGEGFTFSRTIDEKIIDDDDKDNDDGIYVMRTRISWGDSDEEAEEFVQFVWKKDAGGYEP